MSPEDLFKIVEEKNFKRHVRDLVSKLMPTMNDELEELMDQVHPLGTIESVAQTVVLSTFLLRRVPNWKTMNNIDFLEIFIVVCQKYMKKEWAFTHLESIKEDLGKEITNEQDKEDIVMKIVGLVTGTYSDIEVGIEYGHISKELLNNIRYCIQRLGEK